jgi:flagellar basal body-associated protein FliL
MAGTPKGGVVMTLFWTLLIVGSVIVALGWIAYGIYEYRERKLEKQRPKERSERYRQTTDSMTEYAKKLAEFKKPTYKRDDSTPSDTNQPKG